MPTTRPHLATARLGLEPLIESHLEDLVALDADAEVVRHLFGRALTRAEVVERLPARTRPGHDVVGLGFWVGRERGRFARWWCLTPDGSEGSPGSAELGYRLPRHAWGRGLASEGARALLEHGFGTVGLHRVWAETMLVNRGSRRVMAVLGLTEERRLVAPWPYPVEGAELGRVVTSIDAAGWAQRSRRQ